MYIYTYIYIYYMIYIIYNMCANYPTQISLMISQPIDSTYDYNYLPKMVNTETHVPSTVTVPVLFISSLAAI